MSPEGFWRGYAVGCSTQFLPVWPKLLTLLPPVFNPQCFKKKRVAGDVQPSLCSLHQNLRRRKIDSWRSFWNLSAKILKSWWRVWNSSSTILSLNYLLTWWQEQKEGGSTLATCFLLIHIGLTIWLHECMQDWEIPCRAYCLCPQILCFTKDDTKISIIETRTKAYGGRLLMYPW